MEVCTFWFSASEVWSSVTERLLVGTFRTGGR